MVGVLVVPSDRGGWVKWENVADVRAVLERHGLDPEADVAALTAAIEARGWTVAVEKQYLGERGRRFRTLASRPAPDIHPTLGIMLHLSAVALTSQTALAHALARRA